MNHGQIGLAIFVSATIYIFSGNDLSVENALSTMTILYLCNYYLNYLLNISTRGFFLFISACQRITQVLTLPDKEKVVGQSTIRGIKV